MMFCLHAFQNRHDPCSWSDSSKGGVPAGHCLHRLLQSLQCTLIVDSGLVLQRMFVLHLSLPSCHLQLEGRGASLSAFYYFSLLVESSRHDVGFFHLLRALKL
jgi:hypothetical protein